MYIPPSGPGSPVMHTTVNGLGERAGNVPLSSVVAIVKDHFKYTMSVKESKDHPGQQAGGILFRHPHSAQ